MHSILISILLPSYNCAKYLCDSINSILSQSIHNFEFLIYNDASTDNTKNLILSYNNSQIQYVENKKNLGLAASLNKGIKLAKGKYIVRMDADDIALPHRVETLVNFMETNPDIDIASSWVETFNCNNPSIWKTPTHHNDISCTFLFHNPIVHPASIWRKESITKRNLVFNENIRYAQDYDFWVKCFHAGLKFANVPEVLLKYRRINFEKHYNLQQEIADNIRKDILTKLLRKEPSFEQLKLHTQLANNKYMNDISYFYEVDQWLNLLKKANKNTKIFPLAAFNKLLSGYWYQAFNVLEISNKIKNKNMLRAKFWNFRTKISYIKQHV